MNVLEFQLGQEQLKLRNGQVVGLTFSFETKELDNSTLVNIPSFNIHFYTTDENKINEIALQSFHSFLNFWINKRGHEEFVKHMTDLGFSYKKKRYIPLKRRLISTRETSLVSFGSNELAFSL